MLPFQLTIITKRWIHSIKILNLINNVKINAKVNNEYTNIITKRNSYIYNINKVSIPISLLCLQPPYVSV